MADLIDTSATDVTINGSLIVQGNANTDAIGASGVATNGGGQNRTAQAIPFNNIYENRGLSITNDNRRFTVPFDGYYVVSYKNIGSNDNELSVVRVTVNGSEREGSLYRVRAYARAQSHDYPMACAFSVYELSAGDYIQFEKDTGALYMAGSDYNEFCIYRIG